MRNVEPSSLRNSYERTQAVPRPQFSVNQIPCSVLHLNQSLTSVLVR
jgi:hypothetical protein